MSSKVYVLITYGNNPINPTVNPVCLSFTYNNTVPTGAITQWYDDNGTQIHVFNNGTYTLGILNNVLFTPPSPVQAIMTNIFGTYSTPPSNQIVAYNILDSSTNSVSITKFGSNTPISLTATLTFSSEPCCFSEGTNILGLTAQLKEEYRLVQDLMIGDFVKSYLQGYRKVSRVLKGSFVNNPKDNNAANCMYIMRKTQDNGLIEDLTLTRNHGVLVEKLTEDEEKKVDKNNLPIIDGLLSIITAQSDTFEKVMDSNVYKYYHFSLDGDGDNDRRFGVYANGVLVETPSNNMMDGAMNIKPLDF